MFFLRLFQRKKPSVSTLQDRAMTRPSQETPIYFDEEGRRHRADAPYLLPKDEKEIQRLDYQHFILRYILQGNCFAPVETLLKKGCRVLDVGCGTGRWGYELAKMYERTSVMGFDLEEVARTVSTPLNYQFHRGNLLDGLPFVSQQFHYVHQRLLVAAIPLERWPWVIGELRRVTVPGGWVELVEMGSTFYNAGPATQQFLIWWSSIGSSRGIDASKMSQLDVFLKEGNFSSIRFEAKRIPVGSWGGRVGNLLAQNILAGWPSMRPLAHSLLGVLPETFDTVIERLEAEWNSNHTEYEVYFACGQA